MKHWYFLFANLYPTHPQARGRIGATAAGLHHIHSNLGPSCVCDLHHSSQQRWIFKPLREAMDQTRILMILVGFVNH